MSTQCLGSLAAVGLVASVFAGSAVATPLISEFSPNQPGADAPMQTVEISGMAGDAFSGFFLSIETDNGSLAIDRASAIVGTFDANGLLAVSIPDLENPSNTVVLTDTFTGVTGDTLNLLDLSVNGITTVYDAIGVPDNVGDEVNSVGVALGGSDFSFIGSEPQNIFRDSITGILYAVDFAGLVYDLSASSVDPLGFNIDPAVPTLGGVNPTLIPEPASLVLAGLGSLALLGRRRA